MKAAKVRLHTPSNVGFSCRRGFAAWSLRDQAICKPVPVSCNPLFTVANGCVGLPYPSFGEREARAASSEWRA